MRRFAVQTAILLRSALRGLQSSLVTSGVAVITIAIALLLVGSFLLLLGNMEGVLERFGEDLQVVAYLEPGLSQADRAELASRALTIEGVSAVTSVSEEEALERFRSSVGGADLLEGLPDNPLPASLEISLRDEARSTEGIARVVEALDGVPGIGELAHGQDWVEGYARATALIRAAAFGLGGALGLAALLIVANTIRLAVYAREDELEILSLVGAGRVFLRVPFLIEGTLQGAIGGVLAVVFLYGAFRLLLPEVEYGLALFLGNAPARFFAFAEVLWLVVGGAFLGMLGSTLALLGWRT